MTFADGSTVPVARVDAFIDPVLVALRLERGNDPRPLPNAGLEDDEVMIVELFRRLLPGRRCLLSGAVLGFCEDAIRSHAEDLMVELTAVHLRELRAMEFAYLSVVGRS